MPKRKYYGLLRKLKRYRKRNKVGGIRNKVPPSYRKSTQTLGTGTTINYFEYDFNTNNQNNVILLTSILNQVEFRTKAVNWMYMKIADITVSLYPDQKATVTQWLMLWTGDDDSANNVALSDSNKIMTTNTLRTQYRKWRVPNAVLPTGLNLSGHTAINLKDWIVIDDIGTYNSSTNEIDYSLPGKLVMRKTNTEFTRFRVTMRIIFRNAKYPSIAGILSSLSQLNLNKEQKRLVKEIAEQEKNNVLNKQSAHALIPLEWKIIKEIQKDKNEEEEDKINDEMFEEIKEDWQ